MIAQTLGASTAGASRSEFAKRIDAIAVTQGVLRHALCLMGFRCGFDDAGQARLQPIKSKGA